MPMVYIPNAGDVVVFNKKKGILVRSILFNHLSFLTVDNNGKVTPDPRAQNKEANFFNDALLIDSDEELTKNFVIAVNAIKSVPAAVAPL